MTKLYNLDEIIAQQGAALRNAEQISYVQFREIKELNLILLDSTRAYVISIISEQSS